MASHEVFARPPVEEAIISFEVGYLDDLDSSADRLASALQSGYPRRETLSALEASVLFPTGGPQPASTVTVVQGHAFLSADGLDVVRVTRRGVSCHRLAPYTSWEAFRTAAQRVWIEFLRCFGPERVRGIRLRYVNRLRIPSGFVNWGEYLVMLPSVPEEVNTGLTGYLMRLQLADEGVPAFAFVTQAVETQEPGEISVIFDLDVQQSCDILPTDPHIWTRVEALREYRDRLFFASITDKLKALFR